MFVKQKLSDRFYAKVGNATPAGCMEWTAGCFHNGYGKLFLSKKRGEQKWALAHRVAYELVHGPITKDQVVMHVCDNPRCVNVEHLRIGTQLGNIADMKSKNRGRKSALAPHFGMIKRMLDCGITHQEISEIYGVTRPLITLFANRSLRNNP